MSNDADAGRNINVSHITSGYMYFSPSQGLVRVDEAYDGILATSVFNYANVTKEGLVENTMTSFSGNYTSPTVWSGYVMSNYPLFKGDFLVKDGAVFGGLVRRDLLEGQVASVSILKVTCFSGPNCESSREILVGYHVRFDSSDCLRGCLRCYCRVRLFFSRTADQSYYRVLQHFRGASQSETYSQESLNSVSKTNVPHYGADRCTSWRSWF